MMSLFSLRNLKEIYLPLPLPLPTPPPLVLNIDINRYSVHTSLKSQGKKCFTRNTEYFDGNHSFLGTALIHFPKFWFLWKTIHANYLIILFCSVTRCAIWGGSIFIHHNYLKIIYMYTFNICSMSYNEVKRSTKTPKSTNLQDIIYLVMILFDILLSCCFMNSKTCTSKYLCLKQTLQSRPLVVHGNAMTSSSLPYRYLVVHVLVLSWCDLQGEESDMLE